jgi:hypothetical protein
MESMTTPPPVPGAVRRGPWNAWVSGAPRRPMRRVHRIDTFPPPAAAATVDADAILRGRAAEKRKTSLGWP